MPIFDIACNACHYRGEIIVFSQSDTLPCPSCGSTDTQKLMSATSSLTGKTTQQLPGPGDTACCGQAPGHAGCAGPGSCCGRTG